MIRAKTVEEYWEQYQAEIDALEELYSQTKRAESKAHATWRKWKRAKEERQLKNEDEI